MISPKATTQELLLINSVIAAALAESGAQDFNFYVVCRRMFQMIECGERDFEVLKANALRMPPGNFAPNR